MNYKGPVYEYMPRTTGHIPGYEYMARTTGAMGHVSPVSANTSGVAKPLLSSDDAAQVQANKFKAALMESLQPKANLSKAALMESLELKIGPPPSVGADVV